MLTNLRDAFRGQSRSPNIVPFHMLGIVPILRYSTSKKWHDLEMGVKGHSRSITMALSRVVSEIFNVEKSSDLEIWVSGHSRSLKVVPFDRLCMVSY